MGKNEGFSLDILRLHTLEDCDFQLTEYNFIVILHVDTTPANTGHSPNAVSMLGQRRRRWANIKTALGECPVFAETLAMVSQITRDVDPMLV